MTNLILAMLLKTWAENIEQGDWDDDLLTNMRGMAEELERELEQTVLSHEYDNNFTLLKQNCWIMVDGVAIHINKHENGIDVDMFREDMVDAQADYLAGASIEWDDLHREPEDEEM